MTGQERVEELLSDILNHKPLMETQYKALSLGRDFEELRLTLEEILDVFGPRLFEGNIYRKKSLKRAQAAIKKALGE